MAPRFVRSLVASALVASGTVLVAAGPAGLRRVATLIGEHAGVLLIATAALIVVIYALPPGARTAPLGLALIGLVVSGFERRSAWYQNRWELTGTVIAGLGVALSMTSHKRRHVSVDPFRRFTRALGWYTVRFPQKSRLPEPCSVVAIAARVHIDLTGNLEPRREFSQVLISCWASVVVVTAPPDWAVVAGRTSSAHGITFAGDLDSAQSFPNPHDTETRAALQQLASARASAAGSLANPELPPTAVVLSVLGFGGRVEVAPRPVVSVSG